MKHGSLFSGIGGFDLAASRMGWDNAFQVEIDPFCRRVLRKNFPDAQRFTDIKNFDGSEFAGKIDIISGGFPCQPFSVAGQRRGKNDDRALWGEMLRVVRTIRPTWVVGENVAGITSMELDTLLSDLEGIGYTCQAFVVPACAVNALHRRDRVWIVAHSNGERKQQPEGVVSEIGRRVEYGDSRATSNPASRGRQNGRHGTKPEAWEANEFGDASGQCFQSLEWQPNNSSDILRAAYGIPGRVDRRGARIKSLGNAIVPQVAFNIYQAISLLL